MLLQISPLIGIALGSVIPPAVVKLDNDISNLLLYLAIIATVAGLVASFFLRDKPKHPPSLLFTQESVYEPFLVGLKKIIKIKPYLILLWSYGAAVGTFNAIATVLLQLIAPSGYTGNKISE